MIHVIAVIEVAPGQSAAFLKEFHQIVPKVHAEAGCLDYGPTVDAATDIAAQSKSGDDVVTIVERWESLAALKAHMKAPHMLEYRGKVKDLVKGMTLRILEPA